MRKDALLYVADAIEKHTVPDLGFNMGAFMSSDHLEVDLSGHDCGTTACIAGWAAIVLNKDGSPNSTATIPAGWIDAEAIAKEALDLSDEQAQDLFYFSGVGHLIWDVPPSEAVAKLRRLAATCDTEA